MGGLYSLTKEGVQGLMQKTWGAKVPIEYDKNGQPIEGGQMKDSGVQEFANELIARLASRDPIQMPETLTLIGPQNAAALHIIGDIIIDGGGDFGDGFTGTVNVLVNVSLAAVTTINACVVTTTITPTLTYLPMNFSNGLLKSLG